jgi:hypothetical protein
MRMKKLAHVLVLAAVGIGLVACAPAELGGERDVGEESVVADSCGAVVRPTRPETCPYKSEVVIWAAQGWGALGDAFGSEISPCTDAFISVAPALPDKTVLRAHQAALLRAKSSTGQVHAMAELQFASWAQKRRELGVSWREIGHLFRDEMEAAGYCVAAGDTWEINEAPSSIRKSAAFRRDFADLAQGLAEGRPGMPFSKGAVFLAGVGQRMTNYSVLKPELESFLEDETFWQSINRTVRFVGDEVYADPPHVCMGHTAAVDRRRRVNAYAEHLPKLAAVGPASAAEARAVLSRAYVPILSAAWDATPDRGYGTTTVPLETMQQHIRAEVDATRKFADLHATPDGRIGFGFVSYGTPNEWDALASTMADAVFGAYGENSTSGGACSGEGCSCLVDGAAENTGWATFGAW